MKKLCALILALLLALSSLPALAVSTAGKGDTIARNGELAAFTDGNGYIYVSGLNKPVNTTIADRILTIDPYRIVFFALGSGDYSTKLVSINLEDYSETVLTSDAYAACADGDSIYYISDRNSVELVKLDLDSLVSETVFIASEPLERIYLSKAGIVTTLVDGAGAYIQDSISGSFLPFNGELAAEVAVCDGFELIITDSGNLYVQADGLSAATLVDSGVQAWAVIGSSVYYLSGSGNSLTLKSYDSETALTSVILRPGTDMEVQLTASENALFMLSKAGEIYSVDVNGGKLVRFATLPLLSSYALGNGKTLESYRIEAVSGQLNVYGVVNDNDFLPSFTFVNSTSQLVEVASGELMLLSAYAISGESTVWDLLQPAPQYSILRKGSRGDAVKAIQQPLYDLNYYDYYIDGIFGWRTERAIRLLQTDLDMEIDGIADEELQRIILSGKLEAYDPYRSLERGDRGYRVQEMQERLRDLGYLADDADGIFGSRTQDAVELFQSENGLRASGTATSDTLRKLYSSSANACSSYIDLQRGDSGYRVRELNRRLKALYYLEGDVGSSYNSATVAAVKRFQDEAGLTQNGIASVKVQQRLFSKKAPEYSGYITLQRGDENERVKEMQLRLVELGYHIGRTDGYFDRATSDAVKLFQRAIGVKASGKADPDTLTALYSKHAPAYHEPEQIGEPIIELSAYTSYEGGIYYIADSYADNGNVSVTWFAAGDVASYSVRITDDRGNVYADDQNLSPEQTTASIPITSLSAERTYTVNVVAYPMDADDNATYASISFVRVLDEPEPMPTEEPILPEPTEEPVVEPTVEPTEEPIVEPTEEPIVEPTEEPIVEPTEEPIVEPTEEPLPMVGTPVLSIEPYVTISQSEVTVGSLKTTLDIYEVPAGDLSLGWPAENASSYDVQIRDALGTILVDQNVTDSYAGISTDVLALEPGSIYCLYVTAYSVYDGSASDTAVLNFMLSTQAAYDEPALIDELPEEEYYEEEPEYVAPKDEYYEEEPEYVAPEDEYYEEEPEYVAPEDEYYEEEPEYVAPEDEYYEEEPEYVAPEDEYYEEEPVVEEETSVEAYYPTDDPSAWTEPITPDSDPEAIEVMQKRLVEWKWLEKKSFEKGVLDEATIDAVLLFQNTCLEYGMNVELIDIERPEVGVDTLWLLFNADGSEFINPNA